MWKPTRDGVNALPENHDAPIALYDLVKACAGEDFAGGFLGRAKIIGRKIIPHTETRWMMVRDNTVLVKRLEEAGWELIRPLPFGHPSRHDTQRLGA